MREQISGVAAIIAGVASYFLGGLDSLISVFATILIIDTATGMLKGWNNGTYESKKFRQGFIKKIGYIIGIIFAVQLDVLAGSSGILRNAVITFFIANEGMSIIENLGEMGVNFPDVLKNAVKSLKDKDKPKEEEK